VLKASTKRAKLKFPQSIEEFKTEFYKKNSKIDLDSLLNYAWDLGICVLPLNDPGVFHGASWNIEGRHIIVLKQNTKSHARWIYDFLHEFYHVLAHLDQPNTSVLEENDITPLTSNDHEEEREANSFATQVIFGDNVERIAQDCVAMAGGRIENLKRVIVRIAKKENIPHDFLANYLAFRLGHQGQNWWGTANKLQITTPDPHIIAVNCLHKRISMLKLNPIEQNLINAAVSQ
jgi:Zn-dependent peptidase ImmA (M78 family)